MADETTPDGENESNVVRTLREQLNEAKKDRDNLKDALTAVAFREAGFPLDTGAGKLLAKTYDGEPDPEKVKEFASQFDLTPAGSSQQVSGEVQEIEAAGQRAEALNVAGQPPLADPLSVEVEEAKKKGDWIAAAAAELKQFRSAQGL